MNRPAAIFDVDHTLLPRRSLESMFVRHLLFSGELGARDASRSLRLVLKHAGKIPLARILKENKAYLRGRAAAPFYARCRKWVLGTAVQRIPAAARRAVETQRAEGSVLVLLTGALDSLAEPLGEYLDMDIVLATRLAVEDGRLTGTFVPPHPYGEGKWAILLPVVEARGIDLSRSHAYADSSADLAVLERVGHPHVVRPGRRMRAIAERRGWNIQMW